MTAEAAGVTSQPWQVAEGSEILGYEMDAGQWVACDTEDGGAREQEGGMRGPRSLTGVRESGRGSALGPSCPTPASICPGSSPWLFHSPAREVLQASCQSWMLPGILCPRHLPPVVICHNTLCAALSTLHCNDSISLLT